MSEETNTETTEEKVTAVPVTQEEINALVQKQVAEAISNVKSKLDGAFSQRDEALKRLAELEQKEKERELQKLQEEGKHKEAYEMQLAEEKARREVAEKKNIELTRDMEVRNNLSALPFRNDQAREMAYREIVSGLVRNEEGLWIHRSGASISDYVAAFAAKEDNIFLFKQKANTGTGVTATTPSTPTTSPKKLSEMSQEEVLKLAAEGKLPKRK